MLEKARLIIYFYVHFAVFYKWKIFEDVQVKILQ